jgi:TonB-linked SusC/RagA family outer membrane protein
MQFNALYKGRNIPGLCLPKIFLIMRLTTFFLLVLVLQAKANGYAQEKITLSLSNAPLEAVFQDIHEQSGYNFLYSNQVLENAKTISLKVKDASLSQVLKECLKGQPFTYHVVDKTVIIKYTGKTEQNQIVIPIVNPPIEISGEVTDEKGNPLQGVSVLIKGSSFGTNTDKYGEFTITIPDNSSKVLVFSFVGMVTQEVNVFNRNNLNIQLKNAPSGLNEVTVIGYGTQKKVNLTGSVVTLKASQIENRGVANISNILAGQAPGVTVLQRGGSPGRDAGSLNIQGVGTLGNANPLIVVDGIKTDNFTQIDPNDIKSISILKDAASCAIYGIDAANGVILITTKRGVKGKVKVDYNDQYGGSGFVSLPDKVNSYNLARLYNQAQTNDGTPASGLKFTSTDIQEFKDGSKPNTHANTDWIKAIFSRPGVWMSHNLSLSGGTDDTKYLVSLGYLNQDGIMQSTGYKRYTFRLNFDQKISNKVSSGFNLAIAQRDVTDPATVLGVGGETFYLHEAFQQWATDPIRTDSGTYAYPLWSGLNTNPVAYTSSANGYSKNNDTRLTGTAFTEYKIIDKLSLKGVVSTTRDFNYSSNVGLGVDLFPIDPVTGISSSIPNNTSASMPAIPSTTSVARGFFKGIDNSLQLLLNYDNTFGKHQIRGLLGYEARSLSDEIADIQRINLSDPALDQINAADPTNQTTDGNTILYRSQSFFGRLNYIYNDKYLLELNGRDDATSRFAPGHRSAIFPSVSAGWIISKEGFFKVPAINTLKVRASYGTLGNQQINDYQFLSTYVLNSSYIFDGIRNTGINEGPLANTVITWEKTTSKNIGLDISFLNNRLTFTGDYYVRNTTNILLNIAQPAILGAAPPVANAGAVRNKGYDLIVSYKDRIGQVGYYVNANFNKVKNKITDLAGTEYPGRELGDPIYNVYGYKADGIFQTQDEINKHADQTALGGTPKPGDIIYKDLNGDGKVDAKDQTNLGSYFPGMTYGFSFGANCKGFDFSTLWSGVADVKASIAGSRLAQPFGDYGSSPIVEQLNSWTVDNPNAKYPRASFNASYNYLQSSFWVRNTAYLKLRNIQIGYSLPIVVIHNLRISKLRIYVSGENLLTFSPFKIMDPESIVSGDPFFGFGGTAAYPTTKRYLAGLSLTF